MNKIKFFAILLLAIFTLSANAQVKKKVIKKVPQTAKRTTARGTTKTKVSGTRVKITTDSGVIIVRLYDGTPKHRDNFVKLVNEHFYDSLLFHRVINSFMIQGGDPASKNATAGAMLGSGDVGYKIPAELDTAYYHKKGALAAARDGNPEKASSGCQFYIVEGKKYSDAELNMMEQQMGTKFSKAKRLAYTTLGGTPFLDTNYTVFGEVESGLSVVDRIASAAGDGNNRPLADIHMKMEVVK